VIKLFAKFDRNRTIRLKLLMTSTLDLWPWIFVIDWVSRGQNLYQTWAKSNNPPMSYSSYTKLLYFFHPPKN